jgi:hypothetical protein
VLFEEAHDGGRRGDAVGRLAEAVALVGEEHVLDRHAPALQVLDHLLGLHHRDVGVVGAVEHEGGSPDGVEAMERREPAQQLDLGLGVAVLDG